LLMGGWIKSDAPAAKKLKYMIIAGVICLVVGQVLNLTGIAPMVKRIWTPGWVVFSAGWCCLLTAFFYYTIEMKGYRAWAFPLIVVGMNAIAIYSLVHLIDGFIAQSFQIHLGRHFFSLFGDAFSTMFRNVTVLAVLWLILFWMYRRKIFLKL
jgi:predicted acyltransferase